MVLLSKYNFTVEHIAGKTNVTADGQESILLVDALEQSLHVNYTLSRIYRLQGKEGEPEDFTEDDPEEDNIDSTDVLATLICVIELLGVYKKYHNSSWSL
jgi:transcriptional regulator with XRE-family HTH domain